MGTFGNTFGNALGTSLTGEAITAEAKAYITAEGITDSGVISAINKLVKDLKAINEIEADFVNFANPASSKRKAIYPFPGTVATYNKFNLINPVDSDAAYRLVFTGSPNVSSKGLQTTTNVMMDTKIAPTSLTFESHCMDFMISEDYQSATIQGMDIGTTSNTFWFGVRATSAHAMYYATGSYNASLYNGKRVLNEYFQLNKTSNAAGAVKIKRNKETVATNTAIISGTVPSETIKIGKGNTFAEHRYDWASVGDGISDTANLLYFAAIEKYQYAMGRLATVNIVAEGHSYIAQSFAMLNTVYDDTLRQVLKVNALVVPYDISSIATGGEAVSHLTARITTLNVYRKPATLDIPFKNVMVLWIGVNDLRGGATGAVTYANMVAYINTQLANYDKIIVLTCCPINSQDIEAQRDILNDLMRANIPGMTNVYLVDTDSIPELTDPANTTYFSDGLHLTPAGYFLAYTPVATIIESLYS